MTHVLEVGEIAQELAVERLKARTFGDPLDDRRRQRQLIPGSVVTERGGEAGRRLRLEFVGPATEHSVGETRKIVAESPAVGRPHVAESRPGQRRDWSS